MAKRDRKPQPRPALPDRLQRAIEQKRSDAAFRAPAASPRSTPQRQSASRGPRD
jgi:transposase